MKKLILPLFAAALLASCGGEPKVTVCDCETIANFRNDIGNATKCNDLVKEMGEEEYGKAAKECNKHNTAVSDARESQIKK